MARAEGELFKDKIEVSLDSRQIFYLFFGGAVIASMVFVLGVMVGRRVEARAFGGVTASQPASDPLAALDQLERDDTSDLLFPAALRARDDDRLDQVDSALETAVHNQALASDQAAKPESAPARATAAVPEPAAPAKDDTPTAEPAAPVPAAAAPESAEKSVPAPRKATKKTGRFTLQLSSFQDSQEADSFFLDMKNAGYVPYIVQGEVDGATWYRVRLGHYATYNDAIAAKREFEKNQRIIAYVTRVRR